MEARIVREELAKCWRTEGPSPFISLTHSKPPCADQMDAGVNHYEVCHPLTEKYLDLLRTNRVRLPLSLPPSFGPFPSPRSPFDAPCWPQIEGYTKLNFDA